MGAVELRMATIYALAMIWLNDTFCSCRNSFLNIIGVGKTRYTNLQATRSTPGMNTHKNSGNSHAAMTARTKQSVIDFINQKGK
jgi:hypothetical protein